MLRKYLNYSGVVTEGKVNFDLLLLLGDKIRDEAYEFTWVGKGQLLPR